jgi:hypothetical protein
LALAAQRALQQAERLLAWQSPQEQEQPVLAEQARRRVQRILELQEQAAPKRSAARLVQQVLQLREESRSVRQPEPGVSRRLLEQVARQPGRQEPRGACARPWRQLLLRRLPL